jgi:hypothetical protein
VEREGARGKWKLGSYGVRGDAQWDSIWLVEEAKAYAKEVKLDDAPDLWNNHIKAPGINKKSRDKALAGFWKTRPASVQVGAEEGLSGFTCKGAWNRLDKQA